MPTIADQFAANNAKLDALLAAADKPAGLAEQEVTLAEALNLISAELAKGKVQKERAEYLKSVLAEIQKQLYFEADAAPSIKITVISDPLNVQPATQTANLSTIGDTTPNPDNQGANRKTISANSIPTTPAATNFSSNSIAKAQAIQKMLLSKEEIQKSKLTDKLDEVKTMFGITDDDLKGEGYDLRWKIGDLMQLLVNAVKLERLTGSESSSESSSTEKSASGPKKTAEVWPSDLASAKFDDKAGVFKNEPLKWGRDSERRT